MALNTLKCNHLSPLCLKGLRQTPHYLHRLIGRYQPPRNLRSQTGIFSHQTFICPRCFKCQHIQSLMPGHLQYTSFFCHFTPYHLLCQIYS